MWRVVEKCLQSNLLDSLLVWTQIGGKYHWLYRLWYISTTRNSETWEMQWFVWLHKREGAEVLCCTCTFCSFLWIPSKTAFSCRRWSIFILSWELVARELLNRTDDCHHVRQGRETHTDSDISMQQYSGKLLFAEKIDFHDLSVLLTEKRSMLYEKTTCKLRKWISCSTYSLYIQYMQ